MLHFFKNIDNRVATIKEIEDNMWINITPPFSKDDFITLSEKLHIPLDFLTDALDIDERPRFEEEDNVKLIVIKAPAERPHPNKEKEAAYITIPICIILTHHHILTVNSFDNRVIKDFLNTLLSHHIEDRNMMVLKIFSKIVGSFLDALKEINIKRNLLEEQLYTSSSNEALLQLMEIQKSLVYFVTSLRSNELLMMKLDRTNFLQLNEGGQEFLNDLIVDASQALEMANIYTNILSNTLDAFASIISNNQNQVLKRLTSITIILQFPVLISSIYGMNVPIPYQDSTYAFYIPVLLSCIISIIMAVLFLKKKMF